MTWSPARNCQQSPSETSAGPQVSDRFFLQRVAAEGQAPALVLQQVYEAHSLPRVGAEAHPAEVAAEAALRMALAVKAVVPAEVVVAGAAVEGPAKAVAVAVAACFQVLRGRMAVVGALLVTAALVQLTPAEVAADRSEGRARLFHRLLLTPHLALRPAVATSILNSLQ